VHGRPTAYCFRTRRTLVSETRFITLNDQTLRFSSNWFDSTSVIWDPEQNTWHKGINCIWDGPSFISSQAVLSRSYSDDDTLRTFFTAVIFLSNVSIADVLWEIEIRQDGGTSNNPGLALMQTIYEFMNKAATSEEDWSKIK
jgi:hypothetical protein